MATNLLKPLFNNANAIQVLTNLDNGVYRPGFPIHEMALEKIVTECHLYDFHEVLTLCTILDSFYSTRMPENDIIFTARFIVNNHLMIRKMADTGDVELVKLLSNINGCQYNYSFATKLSNWLNHLDFPIYDKFVKIALLQLKEEEVCDFRSEAILKKDYNTFKSALIQVVKNCKLSVFDDPTSKDGINFKKLDKYIWALMNFVAYEVMTNATKQVVIGNKIVYKQSSSKIWVKGLDGIDVAQGEVKQTLQELCSLAGIPYEDKYTTNQLGKLLLANTANEEYFE